MVSPIPRPPWLRSRLRSPCRNSSNRCGSSFGRDTSPGIRDLQHAVSSFTPDADGDPPPGVGVFRRVVEKIDNDLLQPYAVRFHDQRLFGEGHGQTVIPLLAERANGFEGCDDDTGEIQRLFLESDHAAGDAGHIQEIIQ